MNFTEMLANPPAAKGPTPAPAPRAARPARAARPGGGVNPLDLGLAIAATVLGLATIGSVLLLLQLI